MRKCVISIILLMAIVQVSCNKDKTDTPEDKKYAPTPYQLIFPSYFPPMSFREDNPMTAEGIALGRMLYYDPVLHPDSAISCSSCHLQEYGFTLQGSNVLPHINLGWSKSFLWNGEKEGALEDVMLFEVETFFGTDLQKLNNHTGYSESFKKAFNVDEITSREAAYALAQFFRTMISSDSKFDRVLKGEEDFTTQEWNGYDLFFSEKGDCFHCHGNVLFTDNTFHNIGLDSVFGEDDYGRYAVTGELKDMGRFKTPTLRNAALRGGFMHDARFQTLAEVVEHYNSGVKHSASLDPIMTKPGKELGLNLTQQEKDDLVAFLHTLTDYTFITNPNISSPFE